MSPVESTATPAVPAVHLRGLYKAYGQHEVLRGIDLDVQPGEVVCIIGKSGSGKSTLLRCINLLEPIDAGTITVLGEEITRRGVDIDAVRRRIRAAFGAESPNEATRDAEAKNRRCGRLGNSLI